MNLTNLSPGANLTFISTGGWSMKGVYKHRNGFRVYFKGNWFTHDEHGRPFKFEEYGHAFRNMLEALYDPDPAKNRYDPKRFKDRTPYKFDEAFPLYLEAKPNDSSWHKSKGYIWKKYFMPFFANQDFRTIDQVQLEGLQRWLERKNLKGKTIKNIMMTLHGFLNHFRSSFANTFPVFPKISYQQPKIRWFTTKEIDQVFEFLDEEDKGYFWAIRGYRLRPEEASGLLKSAVNWETKEIIISTVFVDGQMKPRTKTKSERVIPIEMCPEAERYLQIGPVAKAQAGPGNADRIPLAIRHDNPIRADSIFVFSVNGHPYTRHMREGRWKKAMIEAVQKYSTRPMTLRDLRHSAATMWAKRIPLNMVRKLLGHSSQEVTERFYADVDVHQVVEMIKR